MTRLSHDFQVFIKPAGARCNLGCRYCYYLDNAEQFPVKRSPGMTDDILELYTRQLIEATSEKVIVFSWHGGEPTLAGLDFFKRAVAFQKKYKPADSTIINGIQTNGTFLNKEWCDFFASENFFVGISIDGPEELHDILRVSKNGRGSFNRTIKGYELLKKYNVRTELLTVVNNINSKFPLEVYRFLKKSGSAFLTFLPLVERIKGSETGVSNISVKPDDFGRFLIKIFDEWIAEDIGRVKIQIIEEAIRPAFNQEHTLCIFKKICGGVPVVEHNGDFYSCDHYVNTDHWIGNITEMSLGEMLECKRQKEFGFAKLVSLPQYCIRCEVRDMCNGECPKNRFINAPDGTPGLNYLCSGYKIFFNHIRPFAYAVAEEWRKSE